jgi:hypothetical protein
MAGAGRIAGMEMLRFHLKMRPQLYDIIASNFKPFKGNATTGMGLSNNVHPPFVTAGRHESSVNV